MNYKYLNQLCLLITLCLISFISIYAINIVGSLNSIAYFVLSASVTIYYYLMLRKEWFVADMQFVCVNVFFLQAVIYPAILVLNGNFREDFFTGEPTNYFGKSCYLWLVGFALFFAGVNISKKRGTVRYVNNQQSTGKSTILIFSILSLISIIGSTIQIYYRGGLSTVTDIDMISDGIRLNRGLGFLQPLMHSSYVAVAYLSFYIYDGKKIRWLYLIYGIMVILIVSMPHILMARRSVVLFHIVLFILPLFLAKAKSNIRHFFPLMIVLLFVYDITSANIRELYYRGHELTYSSVVENFSTIDMKPPLSYDQVEITSALISKLENRQFQIMYGRTIFNGLLNWLPRSLFPDKGWTGGPYLANAVGDGYSFDDTKKSSSLTPGLILELIMNFGIIGMPFMAFLLGYLSSLLFNWIYSFSGSTIGFALWSVLYLHYNYGLIASEIGQLVNRLVSVIIPIFILYGLQKIFMRTERSIYWKND